MAVFPKGDSGCQGKGQPKLGWLLMDHPLLSACRSWILVTVRPEAVVLRRGWSDKLERPGPASAVQMGSFLSEHARLYNQMQRIPRLKFSALWASVLRLFNCS